MSAATPAASTTDCCNPIVAALSLRTRQTHTYTHTYSNKTHTSSTPASAACSTALHWVEVGHCCDGQCNGTQHCTTSHQAVDEVPAGREAGSTHTHNSCRADARGVNGLVQHLILFRESPIVLLVGAGAHDASTAASGGCWCCCVPPVSICHAVHQQTRESLLLSE